MTIHQPTYKSARAEAKAREAWEEQRRVEDLRDNTVSIVLNRFGGKPGDRTSIARAFVACQNNFGPTSATLWKWYDKDVSAPSCPHSAQPCARVVETWGLSEHGQ